MRAIFLLEAAAKYPSTDTPSVSEKEEYIAKYMPGEMFSRISYAFYAPSSNSFE